MSVTREDDHLFFTQRFSSGDYYFVYAADNNNVVGLIHPTPESADTSEDETPYDYVVGNMVDHMLEEM